MPYSRRGAIAVGATGIASIAVKTQAMTQVPNFDAILADLVRKSEQANAALMDGDVETYLGLITLSEDFTLMSPFGGTPSHGAYSRERWNEIGRFFKNGTLKQELVQAYGTANMIVLVVIEHCFGEVGGLAAQEWSLRVTTVYRRDGSAWHLVHRHADPLAKGISLEQAANLARGAV
jgi:ketosteroid isomerase-like protein